MRQTEKRVDYAMDYLPFVDESLKDSNFQEEIEEQIKRELRRNSPNDVLHPEVVRLLKSSTRAANKFDDSLYEYYHSIDGERQVGTSKRARDEELALQEHRKKNPRIEIGRYGLDVNQDNAERLAIIDNYLLHQELVLKGPLSKTMLNQWAINNDYLNGASKQLEQVIDGERKSIQDLNHYRQARQLESKVIFESGTQRWKDKLINNLNVQ